MENERPELRIASMRGGAAHLTWSAIIAIAVAAGVGYGAGNLPDPFQDWMLFAVAGAVVLVGVIVPWWRWAGRSYIITTRRVIATNGLIFRRRSELLHAAGYGVETTRTLAQRISGTGTLTLVGPGGSVELRGVHRPRLVSETLADQVEISQILAHRQAQQLAADPYLEHPEA
ncbi:PH domain-containing protein [Microbacterium indicum]|uniref:PH domain-containing protein n=1 Tax=Microbacterium indicum TaxID=358100 RepID=UPI00041A326C|nr:PH domain-containing protein [Microbacterium indicum]